MPMLPFSQASFFLLGVAFATVFFPPPPPLPIELVAMSDSEDDDTVDVVVVGVGVVFVMAWEGETTRRRDVQLHGAARERLLRALAGTVVSGRKIVG